MIKDTIVLTTESSTIYIKYKTVSVTRHQNTIFFQEGVRLPCEQV